MSEITQLAQAVANLSNRFNQLTTNAKKVNELPPQVVLNPDSLIHVMIDGVSQHISVQQILDGSSSSDLISFAYRSRLNYVDSNVFTLPEGVKALDVRFNGTGSDVSWSQADGSSQLTYEGDTMGLGDYLIVIGVYSNVPLGTIPSLEMVTLQGSASSVTIQSPNAVNDEDLTNLGQVKELIEDFPVTDTNLFNTPLTLLSSIAHNLGGRGMKFTNGDFEVPAITLTETSENTKPNKIGTSDGLIVKWTNKLGIQRVFAFMSDVLDKTTLIAQTVAGKVTFNGTIVHDPPTTPFIKAVVVLDNNNELKQATAVELMADDGAVTPYANETQLDALFPTAVSGFELICPNISTTNFPKGVIYKKTNVGWKVERLYLIADV